MMPKYRRALLIGLVTACIGIFTGFPSSLMRKVEHDWLLYMRGEVKAPPEVVIIAIDKQAADYLEQPRSAERWNRRKHAELIKELVRLGSSVIAFDIAFIEKREDTEEDVVFAAAIKNSARVVLSEKFDTDPPPDKFPTSNASEIIPDEVSLQGTSRYYLYPGIEIISSAARGLGPFPVEKGKVHRFSTFMKLANTSQPVPVMPAVVLQVYTLHLAEDFHALLKKAESQTDDLPVNPKEMRTAEELREYMCLLRSKFIENPQLKDRLLSLLAAGSTAPMTDTDRRLLRALIHFYGGEFSYYYNFYGPLRTVQTIRYEEILRKSDGKSARKEFDLSGKIVFIGDLQYSITGQEDRHDTVFTTADVVQLTGVELAATVFCNLLTGSMLLQNLPASFFALLIFGLLAGGLATLARGFRAVAVILVLTAAYFSLAIYLFVSHTFWISLSTQVLVQAPVGLFMGLFCQYWCAWKENVRLRPWVPPKIVDIPEDGLVFGTCLFTDIRGSRKLSGRLSLREYKSLMDRYHDEIKQPVIQNGGRVIDFYGDGMMCLFWAKKPDTDLRLRAAAAALEILRRAERLNLQLPEKDHLETGIALHSGWIELGGTQLGDVGNTVASIEELNKFLGTRILASQSVVEGFQKVLSEGGIVTDKRGSFFLRRIASFLLPGKTEPAPIFELINVQESLPVEDQPGGDILKILELSSAALGEFEEERWQEATILYDQILALHPDDGPAQFLIGKCREYCREQPLPGKASFIRIGSEN